MKLLVLCVMLIGLIVSCFAFKNDVCSQPHSRNGDGRISCEAYIPRWSFDADANECVKFIYGGCGGNDNSFGTKELCEEKCLV